MTAPFSMTAQPKKQSNAEDGGSVNLVQIRRKRPRTVYPDDYDDDDDDSDIEVLSSGPASKRI